MEYQVGAGFIFSPAFHLSVPDHIMNSFNIDHRCWESKQWTNSRPTPTTHTHRLEVEAAWRAAKTHMKWMSLVCSGWNQSSEIKLGVSVTLLDSGLNPSGWFSRVLQLWPLGNTSMSSVWSCVWLRFFMLRPKEKDNVRQERVFLILNN